MLQGTGSNVGKSVLTAGLCRLFASRGLRVRPFKPQNMSNNAGVAVDGGEIGRAQMLQARACRVPPSVDMNPVLLKPEGETGSQLIVGGQRRGSFKARDYFKLRQSLMPEVVAAFDRLSTDADLMLVEGAGSASEVNLRAGDIANMGFAAAARVPVILIGDIDRGGVIASLVGTHAVLPQADRALIRGFLINRFRGDPSLFADGSRIIAERTGWSALGIVPWFADIHRLPAEDSQDLQAGARDREAVGGGIKIVVPLLPRISNHDDLDPLTMSPGVSLTLLPRGQPLPADVDLVVLPGSKSTISDLAALRQEGWDIDILAHARRGGRVLGLCGGYQMLGRMIGDPDGVEGPPGEVAGLGLLDVETVLTASKRLEAVSGRHLASGLAVSGYEMHMGRTEGADCRRPLLDLAGTADGAMSANGRIAGTYLHGLFGADAFRHAFLRQLGSAAAAGDSYDAVVEAALDALAAHIESHVDIDSLLRIARSRA